MTGRARGRRAAAVFAAVLVIALAVPALAQQPYPPPPPDGDPGSGRVETRCSIDDSRTITCEGEGYLANSTVTIEIRRVGGGGGLVAAYTEQVDAQGEWDTEYQLPCDYTANRVRVRVSGRDSKDRPVTESVMLRVPESPGCTTGVQGEFAEDADAGVAGSPGGSDEVLAAVDRSPDGSLAFTGRNLVLLAALALVLVTFGAVLVGMKRSRGDVGIPA